ncbi:MAG: hypothetical protein JJW00_06865 [Sulfurimonas sp.]|nr:hypothetical protein [Sulfurimonas sp.]
MFALLFVNTLKAYDIKAMPTVSSNPTSGTGGGLMGTLIYHTDEGSSPSQTIATAQYTNTDSYSILMLNNMYFNNDTWHSMTGGGYIYNNTSLTLPALPDFTPTYIADGVDDVKIKAKVFILFQQIFYNIYDKFYIGAQIFYIDQEIEATNDEGAMFINEMGIEDSKRTAFGPLFQYDTRSKSEKFYPRNSYNVQLSFNYFPSDGAFYNTNLNVSMYKHGFKSDDVIAAQFYTKYCSEDTPDGALATLGARNVLRGFPMGQYKARQLTALQTEYRYEITNTNFRLTTFAGAANLSKGSMGTGDGNRNSNNGNYYSGGIGTHYMLQKKAGIDYRVNLVYNSDEEISVYATINQAF